MQLAVGATNPIRLSGLRDDLSGAYQNAATVTASLLLNGVAVPGAESFPLGYEAGTNGNYLGVLPSGITLVPGTTYVVRVVASVGGNTRTFEADALAVGADGAAEGYYTSQARGEARWRALADIWSNVNNDTRDPDVTTYKTCIDFADNDVKLKAVLKRYPALIPTTANLFPQIQDAADDLLACYLFRTRGDANYQANAGQARGSFGVMQVVWDSANKKLDAIFGSDALDVAKDSGDEASQAGVFTSVPVVDRCAPACDEYGGVVRRRGGFGEWW